LEVRQAGQVRAVGLQLGPDGLGLGAGDAGIFDVAGPDQLVELELVAQLPAQGLRDPAALGRLAEGEEVIDPGVGQAGGRVSRVARRDGGTVSGAVALGRVAAWSADY